MNRALLSLCLLMAAVASSYVWAQTKTLRFTPSLSMLGTTITTSVCPRDDHCAVNVFVGLDPVSDKCIVKPEYDLVIAPKKSKDLIWNLVVKSGQFRFNTNEDLAIRIDGNAFKKKHKSDKKHIRTLDADEANAYPYGVNVDIWDGRQWVACPEFDPLIVSRD